MSNTVYYLYLKTHNDTGVKYFGMTKQDPFTYMGSGKRWRNHLFKHGNNVSTEIIFESYDKQEISDAGILYSKLWDIVNSVQYANLKIEEGDGGFDHINDGSDNHRQRSSNAAKKRLIDHGNPFSGIRTPHNFANNKEHQEKAFHASLTETARKKRKDTFTEIKHAQGSKNSQFGTMWITNGISNSKVNKNDPIPEGWHKGRKMNSA